MITLNNHIKEEKPMKKPKNYAEIFMLNMTWLRRTHGLSKKQMSKICHISIQSLNKIESGILPPKLNVDIVFHIQKHFGIPAADLFKELYK